MKLPFEKAYCLHLVEAQERYESSKSEFEKVGILDQIEYWWTVKRPFISKCIDKFPNFRIPFYEYWGNPNIYVNLFNCTYEHYNIVKQAYIRGIESIIIFEDDIFIHVDREKFESIMNNVPSDFDVIQFHDTKRWRSDFDASQAHKAENNQYKYVQYNIENKDITKFYKTSNKHNRLSCLCYALSRKGMKEIIDIHDRFGLVISDKVFNLIDTEKFNYYVPEYMVMSPIDTSHGASYILN